MLIAAAVFGDRRDASPVQRTLYSGLSAPNRFFTSRAPAKYEKGVSSQAIRILSGYCVDAEAGSYHKPLLIAAI
jgi:hypothetical protein